MNNTLFSKRQCFALENFANCSDLLLSYGVISTDSFTGEIGEYIACQYFNLQKAHRVQKYFDATDNCGRKYQVKSKVLKDSQRENFNYNITGLHPKEFQYLIVVYFDTHYKPIRILKIPSSRITNNSYAIKSCDNCSYACDLKKLKIKKEIKIAINEFAKAYIELEKLNIIRSRRIVGDIGEYYASKRLSLTLSNSNIEKGWDAKDKNGIKFEIKTRRVYESDRRIGKSRRLNNLKGKDAKYLIVVTLDRNFLCSGMWIIPMANITNPKSAHLGIVNTLDGVRSLIPSKVSWLLDREPFVSL